MAKSRVSITVWKIWKDHVIIRHHRSMENLRFDKEGYFQISTRYFIKEIENIFPGVPIRYRLYVIYSWNFGRAQNSVETLVLRARVPTSISRSPKLPLVFL